MRELALERDRQKPQPKRQCDEDNRSSDREKLLKVHGEDFSIENYEGRKLSRSISSFCLRKS